MLILHLILKCQCASPSPRIKISKHQYYWYLGPETSCFGGFLFTVGRLPASWLPWWFKWQRTLLQCGSPGFDPWVGKSPWRREQLPTPVSNLAWRIPWTVQWGHKELDTTEQLSLWPLSHQIQQGTLFLIFNSQKCLHVSPNVPWGHNLSQLRTTD